jgi:hypothetical protein
VNLEEQQIADLNCEINAKVMLADSGEFPLEMVYDEHWNIIEKSQPIPEELAVEIPWGPVDMTGTSGAIMYTITVIAGFAFYFHSKIRKIFMPRVIRHAHCFIALISLMFVLAHMSTAIQKSWPWFSIGMISAFTALTLLSIFVVFSFFDIEIIQNYGRKKWRMMHLFLTIGLALFIVVHFGLMGDHLGFLK